MGGLNCYTNYEGCAYHDIQEVEVPGRAQVQGANLFCSIPTNDICVRTADDVEQLRKLGFNKFILLTNWWVDEDNDVNVKNLKLSNAEIMIELTKDDFNNIQALKENLRRWILEGYAGGANGDFFAVFLDEPHNRDDSQVAELVTVLRGAHQKIAVGEYISILSNHFTDNIAPGWDIVSPGGTRLHEIADILFYTGYEGSPLMLDPHPESNQIPDWHQMKLTVSGPKPAFPFIKMSHTLASDDDISLESYTDYDYLDTYL